MCFFFSFVGLLTVNHVYILVLWKNVYKKKSANPNMDCAFFVIWHVFLLSLSLGNLEHVCVTYKSARTSYCSTYWQFPFSDCPFDCTDSIVFHTH